MSFKQDAKGRNENNSPCDFFKAPRQPPTPMVTKNSFRSHFHHKQLLGKLIILNLRKNTHHLKEEVGSCQCCVTYGGKKDQSCDVIISVLITLLSE